MNTLKSLSSGLFTEQAFIDAQAQLLADISLSSITRVLVGFSGGVDSTALVVWLASIKPLLDEQSIEVVLLHVNHGMSDQADSWQAHCAQLAQRLGFAFKAHCIDTHTQANIESELRDARFDYFNGASRLGDILLLAHHANDQAETLFYRMIRGAGLKGLSAMAAKRHLASGALMLKPFIAMRRDQLESVVAASGFQAIDDDSNTDQRFDRNFIRHSVMPLLESRWPQVQARLAGNTAHLQRAQLLLSELAADDISVTSQQHEALSEQWGIPAIDVAALKQAGLSTLRVMNAVRGFLNEQQCVLNESVQSNLEHAITQGSNKPLSFDASLHTVHLDQQRLFVCAKSEGFESVNALEIVEVLEEGRLNQEALLKCWMGSFSLSFSEPARFGVGSLSVIYRQGGESIMYNGMTKPLKQLLSEKRVPSFLRQKLPLIISAETQEILAVLGVLKSDKAIGLSIHRHVPQ